MNWLHAGTAFVAAFLASLVECVEALTIVLAVGTTRGWRPALLGAGASAIFLVILVAIFGPALGRIPIATLQLVVGILLLLFGIRWLRKAILRAAGVIALHDEAKIYEREAASMRTAGDPAQRASFDTIAFLACFKAVALEGLEVSFTVLAIGAGGSLLVASLGACSPPSSSSCSASHSIVRCRAFPRTRSSSRSGSCSRRSGSSGSARG